MKNFIDKLIKRFLYLRREIIAYYCYYFKQGSEKQVKVVIFGQGRTGSTLLEDLISEAAPFQSHVADFLNTLYNGGWKIIYLRRSNKVKHVLSNYVSKARGAGHKYDNKQEKIRVQVETERFIRWVNQRIRFEKAEKKCCRMSGTMKLSTKITLRARINTRKL